MKKIVFFCLYLCAFSVYAQRKQIDSLQKVLHHYTQSDTNYIHTLNELTFLYYTINLDSMFMLAEKGIHLAEKAKHQIGKVEAMRNKGISFRVRGNYAQALTIYLQALSIAEKINYIKGIGRLHNNIALIYENQGKYEEALEQHFKSLRIREKIDDKNGVAGSLNNIALVYNKQGRYKEALEQYFKSLQIREETGDKRGMATNISNIALIYSNQHKYSEALAQYFTSLKIFEEIGDKRGVTYVQKGLASTYFATKNYTKALYYAQEALVATIEIGEKKQIKDINNTLFLLYQAQKQHEKALFHYQQYITYKDSLHDEENRDRTANLQAQYEYDKKVAFMQAEQVKKDAETEKKLQIQRYQRNGFVVGFTGVILIAYLIFRNLQKEKKAKQLLESKNEEIQQAKEEIEEQAKELQEGYEALNNANEHITRAYKQLHNKNQDVIASINAAKRIQDAMLPFEEHIQQSFSDFFILFEPRDIVSGDFYWLMDKGDKTVLIVSDCTGHGIPGAFMSMIGMNILGQIVNGRNITAPDKILYYLHKEIHYVLHHRKTQAKEGMDIGVITLHRNTQGQYHRLEYAGALIPLYYVQKGEFHEIKATKRAIGGQLLVEGTERQYEVHEVEIHSPCMLYLCTDGYQDQFGGEENKKFMTKKLKTLFHFIHTKPIDEQKNILKKTFMDWKGRRKQIDDVTIVGVRI